jgi:two-component system NtrC family response regulator
LGLPPDPDGTREGFRTLKAIIEAKPDTKVIVVSGSRRTRERADGDRERRVGFYQKPIDIDELGLIVRRAFHVRELEIENAGWPGRGAATIACSAG